MLLPGTLIGSFSSSLYNFTSGALTFSLYSIAADQKVG